MSSAIIRWSDPPEPRARLVCIAHAGAGAARFRAWVDVVPQDVAVWGVRLAGRESRVEEPPAEHMAEVVEELLDDLADAPAGTLALFGHCSGAFVAVALARALAATAEVAPRHLFVAGQMGPSCVGPATEGPAPDVQGLIAADLGGSELDPDLAELLGAAVEADLALLETFEPAGAPLGAPITAFVGDRDPLPREQLTAWAQETSATFALVELPGDHLLDQSWSAVGARIAGVLCPAADECAEVVD